MKNNFLKNMVEIVSVKDLDVFFLIKAHGMKMEKKSILNYKFI